MSVYLTIGNTDNKLTQQEWSMFITEIVMLVLEHAETVHFAGFSHPSAPYQNACWCLDFPDDTQKETARMMASIVGQKFRQDSVAWAEAQVEFI